MAHWFLSLAAVSSLLLNYARQQAVEKSRKRLLLEILYTFSVSAIAVAWIANFFEADETKGFRVFAFVMFIITTLVALVFLCYDILMVIDYHKYKVIREARGEVEKLRAMYDKNLPSHSSSIGVNRVISRMTEFCNKYQNESNLSESSKQVCSFFLPEYMKVYNKYFEAIKECKDNDDVRETNNKQMLQCTENFLQQIEDAEEEQENMKYSIKESQAGIKNSDFEASAEAFNVMLEVHADLQETQFTKESKDNDENKKRMLF